MITDCLAIPNMTVMITYKTPHLKTIESIKIHTGSKKSSSQQPSWQILQRPMMPTGTKEVLVSFCSSMPSTKISTTIRSIPRSHRPAIFTEFVHIVNTLSQQDTVGQIACLGYFWRNPINFQALIASRWFSQVVLHRNLASTGNSLSYHRTPGLINKIPPCL